MQRGTFILYVCVCVCVCRIIRYARLCEQRHARPGTASTDLDRELELVKEFADEKRVLHGLAHLHDAYNGCIHLYVVKVPKCCSVLVGGMEGEGERGGGGGGGERGKKGRGMVDW